MPIVTLLCLAVLSLASGCVPRTVRTAAAVGSAGDNSYIDLFGGSRLRIVVPILNSGGYRAATDSGKITGNTMVLSAGNLAGYKISTYAVQGRADGKVRLKFASAAVTKDGETTAEKSPPALPFVLPAKSQHIRLVYLVRNSRADHNMAIAASRDLAALNTFTGELKRDPDVCQRGKEVFCSWVPAGVAVRPE